MTAFLLPIWENCRTPAKRDYKGKTTHNYMKTRADKWVVVNGRVFRLDRVVDEVSTALLLQRTLCVTCEVHLKRTDDGRWAIYWRSKKDKIECTPKVMVTPLE